MYFIHVILKLNRFYFQNLSSISAGCKAVGVVYLVHDLLHKINTRTCEAKAITTPALISCDDCNRQRRIKSL